MQQYMQSNVKKKYALSCSLYDFSDFLALERVKNNFRNGLLISFLMIALKQVHKIHILDDIKIIFFSFSHQTYSERAECRMSETESCNVRANCWEEIKGFSWHGCVCVWGEERRKKTERDGARIPSSSSTTPLLLFIYCSSVLAKKSENKSATFLGTFPY